MDDVGATWRTELFPDRASDVRLATAAPGKRARSLLTKAADRCARISRPRAAKCGIANAAQRAAARGIHWECEPSAYQVFGRNYQDRTWSRPASRPGAPVRLQA